MTKNYCIIGTGVAAVQAAKAIRDHDEDGNILVFGAESSLPYNRIKLSKELFSDLSSEKILLKKEKWYGEQNITVHLSTRIIGIDTDKQIIETEIGDSVHYDKLLICTGAKNRKLSIEGIEKKGVFTIREMKEAENFKEFITDRSHVVLIGGGIQGIETAWSLHKMGKKVTIVEAAPRLMARQLDEVSSETLKAKLEEAGVTVYVNASIKKILGGENVEAILLGDETVSCDSVIYSIGVIPNTDIVKNTRIAVNRGIIVNDRMETSIKNVYAAGDAAEWNGEVSGLWNPAMEQGKTAGKNMAASSASYQKAIPLTVFNAFDFIFFSIGAVDENECDKTIMEKDENQKYTRIFIKDEKIVGVISYEGVVASMPYKAAIEGGVSLRGIDLEHASLCDVMNELKQRQKKTA